MVTSIAPGLDGSQQPLGQCSCPAGARRPAAIQLILPSPPRSYDSNLNASRDDKKNKFASTMEFVEDYLNNVVSEAVPFANEEKNKLTFEVRDLLVSLAPRAAIGHVHAFQLPLGQGWPCGIPFYIPEHSKVWSLPCPSPGRQPRPQPHLLRLLQLQ